MADLTTLDAVKAWAGIKGAADDDLLKALITAQSAYIQTWLNRTLAVTQYTEMRDGVANGDTLVLGNYPVTEVTAVTINGQPIPASPDYVASGYWFDDIAIYLAGYRMTKGRRNVKVVYKAGYADVPPELAQACTELVAFRYKERERIGHQSKSLGGETVAFTVKDFPPDVQTILNNYRKVVPI